MYGSGLGIAIPESARHPLHRQKPTSPHTYRPPIAAKVEVSQPRYTSPRGQCAQEIPSRRARGSFAQQA